MLKKEILEAIESGRKNKWLGLQGWAEDMAGAAEGEPKERCFGGNGFPKKV